MATYPILSIESETAGGAAEGGLRYVALQPIMDLLGNVHGYE